jgi:predicted NUDIX family phosphoesterase
MSIVQSEHVLVVPTQLFRDLGHFQGFCPDVERYRQTLLDPLHTSYRARGDMEHDPNFKQLIPYVIFRFTDANGVHLFQYRRGKGQGESRLHQLRSVGVGGHISSLDAGDRQAYDEGMRRELEEELIIETTFRPKCVGLINDDRNAVGQVHLGIVHLCDVSAPEIRARESDLLDAGFLPLDQIMRELEQFETWSQICLTALFSAKTDWD